MRDTWAPWVEKLNPDAAFKFFTGTLPCLADDYAGDIVHVFAPDTYDELPQKTLKLIEYTLANGYDRLVKVDDDTFFMPLPEYVAELAAHDYAGNVRQHPQHNDFVEYAQGGCYSLSRVAMEAVLTRGLPKTGLEDGNVGKALKTAQIALTDTQRLKTDYRHGIPLPSNDIISAHSLTPQIMHDIFNANHVRLLARYNEILNGADTSEVRLVEAKSGGDESVTLAVQSCGRLDLLKRTLESLAKCALDYPIKETIVYEDGDSKRPEWLNEYRTLGIGEIRWITGGKRVGQWMSCDRLLDEVKTEYILRLEDDFEFLAGKPAFLARSMEILKQHPKIVQVSLRGSDTTSGHPVIDDPSYPFQIQERCWREHWGGWSGNNHVARMKEWRMVRSYGAVGGYGIGAIAVEQKLSKLYLDLGYSIAVLPGGPYIRHIGECRSVAIDKLPAKAKVLIAVPVCHKYAYGSHANDLKIGARETVGRIEAIRATWWNDIKPFSGYVDAKFFYGRTGDKSRTPLPDEVFLDVEDDYTSLPKKVRAICAWALQHRFDYLVKCDDDTAVCIDRLLRTDYEKHDQMGFSNCTHGLDGKCACYITGMGYTLSKRAMQAIVSASTPTHWAEDLETGKILRARHYKRAGHSGFIPGFEKHFVDIDKLPENWVACHAVTPEGMRRLYGI